MDIKKLEEKYKAGETTLEEEEALFQNGANADSELSAWYRYAKHSKKQAPPALEEGIWNTIQRRIRSLKITVFAAAASILLLIVFSTHISPKEGQLTYQEKEAKLQEALALVADIETEPSVENIIYEDELVIIYTNTEQQK